MTMQTRQGEGYLPLSSACYAVQGITFRFRSTSKVIHSCRPARIYIYAYSVDTVHVTVYNEWYGH